MAPTAPPPGPRPAAVDQPRADLVLDVDRCEAIVQGRPVRLTPLELALLRALADAPGRVHSRQELAARLKVRPAPGSRALDNIVMRLRRKLGDPPRAPVFIEAVWGVGYRLLDRSPSPAALRAELGAAAFDALPAPAFVMDGNRRIVLANAAACQAWGVRDGEATGRACAEIVGCHTPTAATLAACCPAADALARRAPVRCTYLARDARRAAYPVEAAYVPLPGPPDGPAWMLVVHRPQGPAGRRSPRR